MADEIKDPVDDTVIVDDKNGDKGGNSAPTPPPTNEERAKAKAEKEAADKAAAEKAEADKAKAANSKDGSDDEDEEEEELDTSVWGDANGDEVAQSVMQTLQNAGVTPVDAKAMLWDAVEAGDPTKVDRDALVEKVGKAKATLIMSGIENVTNRNNQKAAEVTETVSKVAGSKENWDIAAKWAVANMPKEEIDDLRNMIDKGGATARFAAGEIVTAYNADPKNTALEAGNKQITPDSKSTPKVKGLSRREYGEAMMKLERKGGSAQEFAALRAQRKAGKAAGL